MNFHSNQHNASAFPLESQSPLCPGCPSLFPHIFINLKLKSPKQLCDFQKWLKCVSVKIHFVWLCATMKHLINEEIEVISAL